MIDSRCRWTASVLIGVVLACGRDVQVPRAEGPAPLDSLVAIGERVYLAGAFDSARTLWHRALEQSRVVHDSAVEARSLTWLGLVAWRQGDYKNARRLGEEALALKRRLALTSDLFKSYNALGLLAWNEGRLAEATQLFGQASGAARAAGDIKGIAAASGNLALVETELGEFEEARRGFDSMRAAGHTLADSRIEGNALTNLGMLAVRVGNPGASIGLLDSARARYRSSGYATGEQNALGQLGTAYAALGQSHLALAALDSALELSRHEGLRQEEASNLEAMAELYRDAGDAQRALELYARAEPINRELGLGVEAGADLRSEAEIQGELGAHDAARDDATQALTEHQAAGARFEELTDRLILADIEAQSGARQESARHLAAARVIAGALNVRRARAQVAIVEARLADRAGDAVGVLRALRGGGPDLSEGGYGLEQESLRLEARALARLGRLDSSAVVGRRAIAALERMRESFDSPELRTSYLADKQGAYAELAEVLRRLGRTEEAFEVADAASGRMLEEGLATTRPSPEGTPHEALREADEQLRTIAALTGAESDAETELGTLSDSSTVAHVRFLRDRLGAARRSYEELRIRLDEMHSPRLALLGDRRLGTSAMLGDLKTDEAILEYQVLEDSLLIFVGRRSGVTLIEVALPTGGLQRRVRLARELLGTRGGQMERPFPVLCGLEGLLIQPARRIGALKGIHRLVIVPHGMLTYLPFAALVDSTTGRFLAQDFEILTLPSAAALDALREEPVSGGRTAPALVLAPRPDAFPASAGEAHAVAQMLPKAMLLLGTEATEPVVRAALEAGSLVHLATHGELNAGNPMFSFVETAPGKRDDPSNDGRLEVHEILGLQVKSPLVFLSGCETGVGTAWSTGFATGEDFATLARAFLYAGARNVVATLWRVDDEGAAEFAKDFYRHLGTESAAGALAAAQRDLLSDSHYSSPYYWAGYVLSGEGTAIPPSRSNRSRS